VPSNISVSWTHHSCENLIGGVLQGRKQYDVRGASRVCKRRMWRLAAEVMGIIAARGVEVGGVGRTLKAKRYGDVKMCEVLEGRRRVKRDVKDVALSGWVRNEGGEEFEVAGVEF
jgi:tRNA-specific adenosine deaminase 1